MPSWARGLLVAVTALACASVLYITARDPDLYHAYPKISAEIAYLQSAKTSANATVPDGGHMPTLQSPQNASSISHPQRNTTIAKVTMLFGDRNPAYERALKTHERHAKTHNYELYILRHEMIDGIWNKPSWLLHILASELKKPAHSRLEWLFWFDADSVIINPLIPLTLFLPPPTLPHIHLLYASDWNGLNAGIFFLRIHPWSLRYLSAVLTLRHLSPALALPFAEQTAMQHLLLSFPSFTHNATLAPQRWFNAYHHSGFLNASIEPFQARRGDLLVHFAGIGDKAGVTNQWADVAERHLGEWELEVKNTALPAEVADFWDVQVRLRDSAFEEWRGVVGEAQEVLRATREVLGRVVEERRRQQEQDGKAGAAAAAAGDVAVALDIGEEALSAVSEQIVALAGMCESVHGVEQVRAGIGRLEEARRPLTAALTRLQRAKIRAAFDALHDAELLLSNLTPSTNRLQEERNATTSSSSSSSNNNSSSTNEPESSASWPDAEPVRAQAAALKDRLAAVPEDGGAIEDARGALREAMGRYGWEVERERVGKEEKEEGEDEVV